MWVPLAVLSFCALSVGILIFSSSIFYSSEKHQPDVFASFLSTTPALAYEAARNTTQPGEFHVEVAAASILVALAGVGCAAFLYFRRKDQTSTRRRPWKAIVPTFEDTL